MKRKYAISKEKNQLINVLSKLKKDKQQELEEQLGMYEDEYHLPAISRGLKDDLKHLSKSQLKLLYKEIVLRDK